MKKYLHRSGQKVYKANDKMTEKLTRIIRTSERSKSEVTKNIIQNIKQLLVEVGKTKEQLEISFELETNTEIHLPFERKLTFEQKEEITYTSQPQKADEELTGAEYLGKLFSQSNIDKDLLRKRIKNRLKEESQITLSDIVDHYGGLTKGLPELFGYIGLVKEFKYLLNHNQTQHIVFDPETKNLAHWDPR